MEFDLEAFGAGLRGENVGEFKRARADEEWKKKERERAEEERSKFDEIRKSTHDKFQKDREIQDDGEAMPIRSVYGAEDDSQTGSIMREAGKPQDIPSVNAIVAQGVGGTGPTAAQGKPLSAAVRGIVAPEVEMLKQSKGKEPKYREPDINDKFNYLDNFHSQLLDAGLFDKAKEVGEFRTSMLTEKLQAETKDREEAVRGGIAAIKSGNPKAMLAALQRVSKFVPDGNDVTDVSVGKDGKYLFTYGDNPPVEVDGQQLIASVLSVGKIDTILNYDNQLREEKARQAQADRQAKNDDHTAKHQDGTLAETKRNHIAMEGIARTKTADGSDATAEIKNVNFLLKNGIAKTVAEGWEMVRTGKTPDGYTISSDGLGGVIVGRKDTGRVETTINGKTTVVREGDSPQSSTKPAFVEGKIYISNGVKAVYRNGKFEEVK